MMRSRPSAVSVPAGCGNCPFCAVPMHEQLRLGLLVDRCGGCGGRWFDRTELDTWLTRAGVPCDDADAWACEALAEDQRRCPRCAGWTLQAYRCGDLHCHRCTRCRGAFVRPGQLQRLERAGGAPTSWRGRARWWRMLRVLLRPRPSWRQLLDRLG